MKSIRGRYDGNVVVLDEPVLVDREVEVVVQFPDEFSSEMPAATERRGWNWERSRATDDSLRGTVTEELFRQRQGE